MDGPNRSAVECDSRVHPKGYSEGGSARATLERSTPGFQWDLVDFADRCALAGSARALRSVSNGASAVSALAQARSHRSGAARLVARDLHKRGGLDLSECFVDGSFSAARPGDACVGKTKRGKSCKIMAI